jgi:hypothetical protein
MNLATLPLRLIGAIAVAIAVVLVAAPSASGHHRHHYYFNWQGFPSTPVPVYACSPVSTSAVQTAVNNWNANGGLGTIFSYAGTSCTSSTGITVRYNSSLCSNCGELAPTSWIHRDKEILRDSTQIGRVYFNLAAGQFKLTGANANVGSTSNINVIAHELGHAVGLNEKYVDVTGINSCTYPPGVATVMDCAGSETGPQPHDAAAASARWQAAAWGPGAVWITDDSGGSTLTLRWADINDHETGYSVYKNGVLQTTLGVDAESHLFSGLTGGECFYVRANGTYGSNFSSQICRAGPSAPVAPSGVTASASPNNYTALVSWTTNAPSDGYTHEFVSVFKGSTHIAKFYVPHHGTGATSKSIPLGVGDLIPGTYTIEVTTCNARYNPWHLGCTYGGSASVSLSNP